MTTAELIQALQADIDFWGVREVMIQPEPATPETYALSIVYDDDFDIVKVF